MKIRNILIAIATLFSLLSCASLEEKHNNVVQAYLSEFPTLDENIKKLLIDRIVIPGMNFKEVTIASGLKATGYNNETIYIYALGENGEIKEPLGILPPEMPFALVTENKTQFNTQKPVKFTIYIKGEVVVKIERNQDE